MKKYLPAILLILSWPLSVADRVLNSHPVDQRYFFPFRPLVQTDLQWYVRDVCSGVCYIFIFLAVLLNLKNTLRIYPLLTAIFAVQVIDLIHYLLWYRQSEVILSIEGLVMLYATLKTFYNGNGNYGKAA